MMWAVKIIAKLCLSRLRIPYRFWYRAGVFRHGHMKEPDYAISVFKSHIQEAYPDGFPSGATVLELGPGDSLASALIARSYGAEKIYLVDIGEFASKDIGIYHGLAKRLVESGLDVPDLSGVSSVEEYLSRCGAVYLTNGLDSLKQIPSESVDLIWSQAVLEHVRKSRFGETNLELLRTLKVNGKASHAVDFKDHLSDGLNNLRFSEQVWESEWFASSGFYTNRLRASAMLGIFRKCGFEGVRIVKETLWDKLPIPRAKLDRTFQALPDKELLVNSVRFIMSRPDLASPQTRSG